jgi:hypothetical protein
MNKMCGASRMVANEHEFIIRASSSAAQLPLFTKPYKDFRLVVKFIHPNFEGECYVSKSTFGLIVKSILIPNDLMNRIFEVAAVVQAFICSTLGASTFKSRIRYSKISLVFGVDCKLFCEGVKGNAVVEQKPENTQANCSILPFPSISTTVAMAKPNVQAQVNVAPLKMTATENMCAGAIECSSGLVGRIDCISLDGLKLFDLVGCTSFVGQVSLVGLVGPNIPVGRISFVSLSGLSSIVGHIGFGFIGHTGLVGIIGLSLISLVGIVGLIGFDLDNFIGHNNLVDHIGRVSHTISLGGIISIVNHTGLIGHIGLLSLNGLVGLSFVGLSLAGLISHISLAWLIGDIGFIGLGLVGFIGLGPVSPVGLIGQIIGLIGLNGLSLIDGFSLISLVSQISLVSFIGLIGHNGLIDFIGLGFVSLIGFICLFDHIGLVGCIGRNSLAGAFCLSLVSLVGLSIYWPFKLATHGVDIKLPSVTGITKVIMQAAHGVSTVSSATKITNAAIWYYCTAFHLFVRED